MTYPARPAERPSGVKKPLTPKRPYRVVENDEYAAFLRRVIRAYSRRIASGDIEAITTMARLADDLEDATRPADRPSGVKKPLTPKRPYRVVENDEYAAFLRRVIAAYSRRVAAGDIEAITDMARLEDATRQAITGLRESGYSWADIAMRLGITRQGAQQRWGDTSCPVTDPASTHVNGGCP